MKINYRGFTLIELLVVVSIIAILSTLTVVYFETVRMSARDTRRLSDVKQIQLALKMFYNDLGYYPTAITAGNSIANGGTNYLLRIPSNPLPRADNGCTDEDYKYTQLENGQRYSLSFCLGDKTDDLDPGIHNVTHNGILNCPTGYVAIPGSETFNTNDFCVMKYEAKCVDNLYPETGLMIPNAGPDTYDYSIAKCDALSNRQAVSLASGFPIANIDQTTAKTICQEAGAHLMTNAEWMTIARNLEQVTTNWSDGGIGSGFVPRGNYHSSSAMDGSLEYGSGGSSPDYLRTLNLSTGEKIWDLSGNVSEILADTCDSAYYEASHGDYFDWNDPSLTDYELGVAGPLGAWISDQGIGKYNGCTTGNIFLRGGKIDDDERAIGIYSLNLAAGSTDLSGPLLGFRCVK